MHTGFTVKNYFKDWKNILTFLGLLALAAAGIFLRIRNLGHLAFWGDDGHTFIGTISILNHGYPLLPSGNILWHGILGYYLDVIPVLIFGAGEFAFRITSVFFGVSTIVLIYFVGKDLANKYIGFLSAFLITFSNWYIYFSREVRYYSTLQFFFLLSFYFFYRGFVKNNKKFIILATVFICLTHLVHGIGFLLLLLFIPLLFYLGRKFFKARVLVPLAIIFAFNLLQVINQVFFWKVGRSFYATSSGLRSTLAAYLKAPDLFYFKILETMFPKMFIIFGAGILIFISFAIYVSIRQTFTYSSIKLNEDEIKLKRLRIPLNIFTLYFIFIFSILIVSLGQMYNQQRYIYFIMPFFILIFAYILYLVSIFLSKTISLALKKLRNKEIDKRISSTILIIIFLIISFFTISGIDINEALAIPEIKHSDMLNVNYSISSSRTYHWDAAEPGKYVRQHMSKDDIVITTDIYNSYPYTRKIDYWLWTGDLVSWAPYHREGSEVIDDTYGVRVLRSLIEFIDLLETNRNSNIWLIASPSLFISGHIDPKIRELLGNYPENLILTARDNVSRLYYFQKDGNRPSIETIIPPTEDNLINPALSNGTVEIDFTNPSNSNYLVYGMDSIENGIGSWGMDRMSLLYVSLEKNKNYVLKITARPLLNPEIQQTMEIFLDNQIIGSIEFPNDDVFNQYFIEFSTDFIGNDINILKFIYSYSITPAELGITNDSRNLSVLFVKIAIEKID